MKFGQLIELNKRNIFQKLCRNEPWRLVPGRFLLFYKSLLLVESKWSGA